MKAEKGLMHLPFLPSNSRRKPDHQARGSRKNSNHTECFSPAYGLHTPKSGVMMSTQNGLNENFFVVYIIISNFNIQNPFNYMVMGGASQ